MPGQVQSGLSCQNMSNSNRSLSESQILEFQESFNTFDEKMSGLVSTKQLGNLLRHLGINPTKEELQVRYHLNTVNALVSV